MSSLVGWKPVKLGDLATYINGKAFKPTEWTSTGCPIIRIQNLTDPSKPMNCYQGNVEDRYKIKDGDLLISWSATLGAFIWKRGEAYLNQHIFKVIPIEHVVEKEFLYFLVLETLSEMEKHIHGSTMKHITKKKFEEIDVSIPELPEQRRIILKIKELLNRVDELQNLRERSLKESEALLGAVIEDIFREAGGNEVSLADVTTIEGKLVDPREVAYKNMLHVGGANIVSETGELIKMQTAEEEKLISGKFVFNDKDVLYSKIRPYLKKVARPDFTGLCSADMYPLRPAEDRLHRDYLFFLLLSRDFTNYAIKVSNRAGMPKVNREQLFAYRFNLPSYQKQTDVIEKLNESMQAVLAMVAEMKEAVSESDFIQQSILKKAFAGEL